MQRNYTYHRHPIVSANIPPSGAPAAEPVLQMMFIYPCHKPMPISTSNKLTDVESNAHLDLEEVLYHSSRCLRPWTCHLHQDPQKLLLSLIDPDCGPHHRTRIQFRTQHKQRAGRVCDQICRLICRRAVEKM